MLFMFLETSSDEGSLVALNSLVKVCKHLEDTESLRNVPQHSHSAPFTTVTGQQQPPVEPYCFIAAEDHTPRFLESDSSQSFCQKWCYKGTCDTILFKHFSRH